jgi:hypothetical protein
MAVRALDLRGTAELLSQRHVVTPDNSTLIIGESFAGRFTAFDIDAAGSLSNRRAWAEGLGRAERSSAGGSSR